MLRGGVLGTAAGMGAVLLNGDASRRNGQAHGHDGYHFLQMPKDPLLSQVLEVSLYTIGGLIAGKVIQGTGKKNKKVKRK